MDSFNSLLCFHCLQSSATFLPCHHPLKEKIWLSSVSKTDNIYVTLNLNHLHALPRIFSMTYSSSLLLHHDRCFLLQTHSLHWNTLSSMRGKKKKVKNVHHKSHSWDKADTNNSVTIYQGSESLSGPIKSYSYIYHKHINSKFLPNITPVEWTELLSYTRATFVLQLLTSMLNTTTGTEFKVISKEILA